MVALETIEEDIREDAELWYQLITFGMLHHEHAPVADSGVLLNALMYATGTKGDEAKRRAFERRSARTTLTHGEGK